MTDFEKEFDEFIEGRFYDNEESQVQREIIRAAVKHLLPLWVEHYSPERMKEDAEFMMSCMKKGPDYKEEYSWNLDGYNTPFEDNPMSVKDPKKMIGFPGERGHDDDEVQDYSDLGGPIFQMNIDIALAEKNRKFILGEANDDLAL